jgi:hypothetical protein
LTVSANSPSRSSSATAPTTPNQSPSPSPSPPPSSPTSSANPPSASSPSSSYPHLPPPSCVWATSSNSSTTASSPQPTQHPPPRTWCASSASCPPSPARPSHSSSWTARRRSNPHTGRASLPFSQRVRRGSSRRTSTAIPQNCSVTTQAFMWGGATRNHRRTSLIWAGGCYQSRWISGRVRRRAGGGIARL